jgi:3-oxoacyl-[acyl-carrier protein] reductase
MSNKNDQKQTVLITGASCEIGLAVIKQLNNENTFFILHTNNNQQKLSEFINAKNISAEIFSCDFSDTKNVDKYAKKYSQVDVLVNLAAVTTTDLLVNLKEQDILKMLMVNNLALVKFSQAIIFNMMRKRTGCIVNISSVAAKRGNRGQSVYAATKGFVESFTRSLAAEYGARGVRVNCVAPGAVDAGSLKDLIANAKDELLSSIASKRFGTADEIAKVIAFLCSEDSSFINGQIIPVDGGFMYGL